jgi:pantoate--beta-alanine ligase
MGALHDGHLSLIKKSMDDGHLTICSIFVNPSQFNQSSDFELYPRIPELDLQLLSKHGCDVVFMPDVTEIYTNGIVVQKHDFGAITHSLEGVERPGHFDGVITIVKKLFELSDADHAYFGQKDYQQCMVVNKLITHYKLPVVLHIIPTTREKSGLAMSSRNLRLNEKQQNDAVVIFQAMQFINQHITLMEIPKLLDEAVRMINQKLKTEYLVIADAESLQPVSEYNIHSKVVVLVAAWCGDVRLIDNLVI